MGTLVPIVLFAVSILAFAGGVFIAFRMIGALARGKTGFRTPRHLMIGAIIGIVAGITGIGAGIYSTFATADVAGDPCKKAVACCRKSGKAGPVCNSYLRMNGEECEAALEGYPRCFEPSSR
jgi:hypothetical protein